jgi:pimeloyl-ACP methyl ester carboxylesterase
MSLTFMRAPALGSVAPKLFLAAITALVTPAAASTDTATSLPQAANPEGFEHHTVVANGVRLHYVTSGEGEPVLLIPGWPQSWYAWRNVMKHFVAAGRRVYALDPRGFGDSEKPASGYDLKTASDDIHAFIQAAGLAQSDGIDVVSHDVGTWIAYSHARAYPEDVRRLVLSEAAIPGTTPPAVTPSDAQNIKSWHFGFNRLDDLPEILVQGHERAYLTWLFANKSMKPWKIDPVALDEYVRVFSAPGAARAGFDYYRQAFNEVELAHIKDHMENSLSMPVYTLAGAGSLGAAMLKYVEPLAEHVSGIVIDGCGHYLPEECDAEYAQAVLQFWQSTPTKIVP